MPLRLRLPHPDHVLMGSRGLKMAPRWSQMAPRWGPGRPQDGLKNAQDRPKRAPRGYRSSRGPYDGPKRRSQFSIFTALLYSGSFRMGWWGFAKREQLMRNVHMMHVSSTMAHTSHFPQCAGRILRRRGCGGGPIPDGRVGRSKCFACISLRFVAPDPAQSHPTSLEDLAAPPSDGPASRE